MPRGFTVAGGMIHYPCLACGTPMVPVEVPEFTTLFRRACQVPTCRQGQQFWYRVLEPGETPESVRAARAKRPPAQQVQGTLFD